MSEPDIESIAAALRGCQADLLRPSSDGPSGQETPDRVVVTQVGGVAIPEPFRVPVPGADDPVAPRDGEPTIETFIGDGSVSVRALGADPAVAAWWRPSVEALIERVGLSLASLGVELGGPIYVTASATPLDRVTTVPHLDDDQYHPEAGVGVVAIAASHCGPRLARGALGGRRAIAGAPLELDPAELGRWFDADDDHRQVQIMPADRVVLFPRFGQLHAGPTTAADGRPGQEVRNLLVLRADTMPVQDRVGSGPT